MIHRSRLASRIAGSAALVAAVGLVTSLAAPGGVLAFDLPPTTEGRYVYDFAQVFRPATLSQAQAIATMIKVRTEAQVAIVSWPSDDDSVSPEEAVADGRTIMDTWGVGRAGVNDGIVVLFDMNAGLASGSRHGQITIVTGKGYRDLYLSEGEATSIINDVMLPDAKAGDLDAALLDGLQRIDAVTVPGGNPAHAQIAVVYLVFGLLVAAAGIALLAWFLSTWWRRGRDAEIPLIDDSVLLPAPPPGMTPALATVLRKDGIDSDAFTSALIDLGHRGLLVFRQTESDRKKVDFEVPPEPLDDPGAVDARKRPLGDAEASLLSAIRTKSSGGVLDNATLRKGTGASLLQSFRKNLGRAAQASPWFRDDPTRLTGRWQIVGIAVLVLAGIAAAASLLENGPDGNATLRIHAEPLAIGLAIAGVVGLVVLVCSRFLAARTEEGGQVLAMSLAYRNTLRHVIADAPVIEDAVTQARPKLPWIGTPDELAVWATALGLRKEVDDLFKRSIQDTGRTASGWAPIWYAGTIGGWGDFAGVIGSISTTSTSASGSGYGGGSSGGGGGSSGGF